MGRRTIVLGIVALCLSPVFAGAAEPSFAFRYVGTEKKTVRITYVDPKGLASQMGLEVGDTFIVVNKNKIENVRDVEKTFGALRGEYQIVVLRPGKEKGSAPVEVPLEGCIKESQKEPGKFYKTDK